MQKFLALGKEVFFLPQGDLFFFGRRKIFQAWKSFRLPQGDFFPCGRKNMFERKELPLRAKAGRNEKPLA